MGVGGCWGTLHWTEYLLPGDGLHLPQCPVLFVPAGTRGRAIVLFDIWFRGKRAA